MKLKIEKGLRIGESLPEPVLGCYRLLEFEGRNRAARLVGIEHTPCTVRVWRWVQS